MMLSSEDIWGFLKQVPYWISHLAAVGIVLLVVIHYFRGYPVICGGEDWSFLAKSCGPTTVLDLPPGAVVAFNREEGCPTGWEEYPDAGGRFIVGAGRHTAPNDDGTPVDTFEFSTKGGLNKVSLEIPHMAEHRHENPSRGHRQYPEENVSALQATGRGAYGGKHGRPTQAVGEGKPHENMPPYVALLYCEKK